MCRPEKTISPIDSLNAVITKVIEKKINYAITFFSPTGVSVAFKMLD